MLFALGQSGPFDNTVTELAKNEQLMDGIPKGLSIEHTAQVTDISVHRSHNTNADNKSEVRGENAGNWHY